MTIVTEYQQAVTRLVAAADVVAEYRADLAAFADNLGGKKWGTEVTGLIQDMNGQLTALEGEYRDLAAQMKSQGDQGAAAHEQAPWVPDSLLDDEAVPTGPELSFPANQLVPSPPTPGNPGMEDTEPIVTYTTPEVSRNDFDDYQPGKNLDSVQDTVADLLETYRATEVNPIITPTGVKFEVTGPRRYIEQLADLYGGTLPSTAGSPAVSASGAKPSRLPHGELTVIKTLTPGTRAAVDLVQDADGRVAIRKTFHPDADEKNPADREIAAAAVANAVGITDLEVRRVDPDTVLMTYFEGKTGTELAYSTMSPEDVALLDDDAATNEQIEDPEWLARWSKADKKYRENLKRWMQAPGAKEIGLFDYLALNIDRNSSNWIVDDDGVVHPIDHDATFIGAIQQQDGLIDFDSLFMRTWLAKDDVSGHRRPNALASSFSRSQLEQVMDRLEDAKPALDKIPPVRGLSTYDLVRQRLVWLIEACDATT